jgi:hypothetical protein
VADTRYIIDLILRARDETARAVASATGNLGALEDQSKKTKQSLADVGTTDMSGFRSTLRAIREDSDKAYTGVKKLDGAVKDLKDRDRLKLKPEMDFGQFHRDMDRMSLDMKRAEVGIRDVEDRLKSMGGVVNEDTGKWTIAAEKVKEYAKAHSVAESTARKHFNSARKDAEAFRGTIRDLPREMERMALKMAEANARMSDDTGPNRLEYAWGEVEGKIKKVIKAQEEGNVRGKQLAEGELSALRQQISAMEEVHSEEEVIAAFEEELHTARSARAREVLEQIDTEARRLEKMRLGDVDNMDRQVRKLDELNERLERIGGDGDEGAARIRIAMENLAPTEADIDKLDQRLEKLAHQAIKPELSDRDRRIAEAELREFVQRMERIMPDIDIRVNMHRQEGFAIQAEDQMLRERDERLKSQMADRAAAAREAADNARAEATAARELTTQRREALRLSREWEQTIQRASRLQGDRDQSASLGIDAEHIATMDRQIDRLRRKLIELGAAIKAVSAEDLQVNADVDAGPAMGDLIAFMALKEAADNDIDVKIDVDMAGAAAELAAFNALKARAGRPPSASPWQTFKETVTEAMQQSGSGIAAFDNQIRGMVTLVIGAAIQPLITVVGALGGELIALASSATMAGAALGGGLAAGALQAIPVIGLLASAIGQIKGVSDVMKQTNLLDQQQFGQKMKPPTASDTGAPDRLASANDAVKNAVEGVADAQDNLADSHDRVKEAQVELTEALAEAQRQYEDLMQAEIDASIAARGAALNQEDAQKALDAALREGRIEDIEEARLRLDEANQGVDEATTRARRAEEDARKARRSGVDGMPGVEAARDSLKAAEKAAVDAADGVDKAKRSLAGAQRGLAAAGKSAASAGDDFLASEAKLQYLMDHLTDAQRGMLGAMMAVRDSYRKNILPLTDVVVEALTGGMIRANEILNDRRFLRNVGGLADELGASINQIVNSFTDNSTMEQWLTLIAQARNNLGDFTDVLDDFGHAFINIGVAANPVMEGILGWLGDLGERLRDVTSDENRMYEFFEGVTEHLLAWLDLGGSVIGLFLSLARAGGAEEGLNSVEAMTATIRDATHWVEQHQDKVRQFFGDVREVMSIVAGVMWEVAKAFARTFEVDKVSALATILTEFLIPALEQAVEWLGLVLEVFAKIVDLPVIGDLMKFGLAFLLLSGIIGKFLTLILPVRAIIAGLPLLFAGAAASGGFAALIARFGVLGGVIAKILKFIPGLRGLGGAITAAAAATAAGGAAAAGGAVAAAEGGAVGAAGTKVGRTFMTGFKGVVKKAGFIGVGLAALDGVITGFKTGSVENGIRDFASSLTFGLIDSTEKRAEKSLSRLQARYEEVARQLRDVFPDDHATPENNPFDSDYFQGELPELNAAQQNVPLGQDPRVVYDKQDRLPSQFEKDLKILEEVSKKQDEIDRKKLKDKGFSDEEIKVMIDEDKLSDSLKDSGLKLQSFWERIYDMRVNADKKNILFDPNTLINAMKKAARKAPEELRPMYEQMIAEAKRAAGLVEKELRPERLAIKFDIELQRNPKQWKKITDAALLEVASMKPEMREEGYKAIKAQAEGMAAAGVITKARLKQIKGIINDEIKEARQKAAKHTRGLLVDTVTNVGMMVTAVSRQLIGLTRQTNNILKKLGASAIALAGVEGVPGGNFIQGIIGGVRNVADGGAATGFAGMPGERGKDSPRLMVGRGEAVLNWAQQAAVNARMMGQDTIQSVVQRVRGWHAGGSEQPGLATGGAPASLFDGHPGNVNSGVARIIQAIKKRFPLIVSSTTDHSKMTASGNISDHWQGDAVDISGSVSAMNAAARWVLNSGLAKQLKQGIYAGSPQLTINDGQNVGAGFFGGTVMGMHGNHLHLAIAGAVHGVLKEVKTKLKNIKFEWPGGGALKRIGQKQIDLVHDAAQKKIRKAERRSFDFDSTMPPGQGTEAPPGQVRRWLTAALKETGHFTTANLNALYGRAIQESGGNPRAINLWDSNAKAGIPSKGLLQTIDPTFRAYMKKGMGDIWNPVHNAIAAIRYMFARYGHIVGPSSTGYFDGGRTPGREGQPFQTLLHGDEHVVTAKEVRNAPGGHNFFYALRKMLGGGGQGGSGGYASGGKTLMVGDSLGVGMENLLKKMIDGLHADNLGGRNSTQGIAVLKSKLTEAYKSVIFEMGTNDYTAEMMAKNIRRAHRIIGRDREMVVSTVRGREAEAKNEWLREFAQRNSNVRLVRGASVTEGDRYDGIHYRDYKPLARAFAGAHQGSDSADAKTSKSIRMPWERFASYDESIRHEQELEKLEERRHRAEKIVNDEKQKKALHHIKELEKAEDKRHDRIIDQIEKVLSKEEARWDRVGERQRQRMTVEHGLYAPRAIAPQTTVRGIDREIGVLWKAVGNIEGHGLGSGLRKLMYNLNALAGEGGLLDQMGAAIENHATDMGNALGLGRYSGGFEKVRRRGKVTFEAVRGVRERIMPQRAQRRELGILEETGEDYRNMAHSERGALRRIERRIDRLRRGGVSDEERDDFKELMAARVRITEKIRQTDSAIAQNLADRYAKQIEVFNAETERRMKTLSRRRSFMAAVNRVAQFAGDYNTQTAVAQDNVKTMQKELATLRKRLSQAQKKGLTEVAEALEEQINELVSGIKDAQEQVINTMIAQVDNKATPARAFVSFLDRMASVTERAGNRVGGLQAHQYAAWVNTQAIKQELAGVMGVLNSGQTMSAEQRQQLQLRVMDLTAQLAESEQTEKDLMLAMFSLRAEMIAQRTQFFTGAFGGLQGIVNALSKEGEGNSERLENLQGTGTQLRDANQKYVSNILSNDQMASALSRFGINLGAQGLDFVDQIQKLLGNWDAITAGMDENTKMLFQQLIQQLIDNQGAIADNTKAIDELTNASTELQGYSTTAWQMYRTAIFNGLGGLLPAYQVPQAHTGGLIPKTGLYELEIGEEVLTNAQRRAVAGEDGSGDTIQLNVTNPTEMLDTTYVANRIAHAKKTRGR